VAPMEMMVDQAGAATRRAGRWEWGVCWLMFASTTLCYMDRQTIALVRPAIMKEFGIRFESFGWALAAFSLSYALFQVPAGFLADRWNVRWTYAGAVGWWSLAAVAAGFSPTLSVLLVCRALLGVGESFNWPCALRVTANVLPPADRSLGNGIFNSGAAVGAVLAPLTVPLLAREFGWRTAFIVVGMLGFVWVGAWLIMLGARSARSWGRARPAAWEGHVVAGTRLSARARIVFGAVAALAVVVALSAVRLGQPAIWWGIALWMFGWLAAARVLPLEELDGPEWSRNLGLIVRLRRFWVLAVVSISVNVCWHFLVNWMPSYFQSDRRFGAMAGGMVSALPFLAADAGNLGGGALARLLAGRGLDPTRARFRVVALGALLISSGAWVRVIPSDALIITVLMLVAFGTAAYMANYFAFCQEVSPPHTGLVVGILGGLGNLFAAGFLPIAGRIRDTTGSFGPSFVVVGLLPLVGVVALALGWGRAEVGVGGGRLGKGERS
jgi:ACS family hexuronate transporter-like MFS transporter